MSVFVKITETSLRNSEFNATLAVQNFLKEAEVHDFSEQEPGDIVPIQAYALPSNNTVSLTMKIPPNRGGREKRIGLLSELVNELDLEAGDSMELTMAESLLFVSKVMPQEDNSAETASALTSSAQQHNQPHEERRMLPDGFFGWAASSKGGVRKPFDPATGRPIRNQIETPILERLKILASNIADDIKCSVVLLVGGPGNGKTDSIETFIASIDDELNLDGTLTELFEEGFRGEAKRCVTVQVPQEHGNNPVKLNSITLVQDASQGDETPSRSHELLLEELQSHLEQENQGDLLICCINRGILDQARHKARRDNSHKRALGALEKLTFSITPSAELKSPWPLDCDEEGIFAWPMDVDSLVASSQQVEESPFLKILSYAVEPSHWDGGYDAAERCPFATNRELLGDPERQTGLSKLLYQYQVAVGKRWSFRELYGLVSFLMVGSENEFTGGTGFIPPKDFSSTIFANLESGDFAEEVPASYAVFSKLYYHQLFPDLPDFVKIKQCCDECFDRDHNYATALMGVLCEERKDSGRVIDRTLDKEFRELLDPALADAKQWVIEGIEGVNTMLDIERRFSISVREGLNLVSTELPPLEKIFFDVLSKAEQALDPSSSTLDKKKTARASEASRAIRKLASIIFKRSFGVRKGIGKDSPLIQQFLQVIEDRRKLSEIRAQVEKLISNRNIPLMQIIGEPSSQSGSFPAFRSRSKELCEKQLRSGENLPKWEVAFIEVDDDSDNLKIPLTFSLFKALRLINDGTHPACLPLELMSGITNLVSVIGGKLVRDNRCIDDPNSEIALGAGHGKLDVSGLEFRHSR